MTRVLAVDIGNTNTSLGLARNGRLSRVRHVPGAVRGKRAVSEAIASVLRGHQVDGAVLSSVVPASNRVWRARLRGMVGTAPLVVDHRLELGITIAYPRPATIGADRLANACGAVARYGAPVIVADFGTALTFDVVSGDGAYVGGVIAPGLPLMTDYLAARTALLPHVTLKASHGRVGRSTEGAMRIGAKVGYRGMVREIVSYLEEGLGTDDVVLCATGGFAKWVLGDIDMPFVFDSDLTLFGLSRIFDLNRGKAAPAARRRRPRRRRD
jgi:type III pantothenate kinase